MARQREASVLEGMMGLDTAYLHVLAFLGDTPGERRMRALGAAIGLCAMWWCARRLPAMTQGGKTFAILVFGGAATFVSWSPFFERDAYTRTALALAWLLAMWALFCLMFFRAAPRRKDYSRYRHDGRRRRERDSVPFGDPASGGSGWFGGDDAGFGGADASD
jgi:hypothetical protein